MKFYFDDLMTCSISEKSCYVVCINAIDDDLQDARQFVCHGHARGMVMNLLL